jgi:hypothetical protein
MASKFLALAAGIVFVLSFNAMAEEKGAGCGLGKMLFEGKSGMVPHILAATTNGSSGNNTFGITSGTSGCEADSVIKREHEQEVFVANNFDNLSQDMARGDGWAAPLPSMAISPA